MPSRQTRNVIEAIKIRRGGECFWCVVLRKNPDGSTLVRVDNDTTDPAAPKYGEQVTLSPDEEVLAFASGSPRLRLVS